MSLKDYGKAIKSGVGTTRRGMGLTWRNLRSSGQEEPRNIQDPNYFDQQGGTVTVEYPSQRIPVPDTGRYRLYTEIEDCIGCDKCARVCPVDCITIEKVRTKDDLGLTSDGSKKSFYFPTFDIDMAKCMYCGLCTVVCPTECIIMTKSYDFSTTDREDFIHHFGNLGPAETAEKQAEWDKYEAERKAAKAKALAAAKAKKEAAAKAKAEKEQAEQTPGDKDQPAG